SPARPSSLLTHPATPVPRTGTTPNRQLPPRRIPPPLAQGYKAMHHLGRTGGDDEGAGLGLRRR
ncbi:MAG: hypothetical protein GY832_39425, partial [Chloroflexi bacterium]|nr:hypothetical protein [Chloroflexota bacterium]